MRTRLTKPAAATVFLLLAAFSTGNVLFLTLAAVLLLCMVLGYISVRHAAGTLRVKAVLTQERVHRGEDVELAITLIHRGFLPVASLRLTLSAVPEEMAHTLVLQGAAGKEQTLRLPFHAAHVGVSRPGIRSVEVEDVFGLFSQKVEPASEGGELLVLPLPFEVEALTYAPGDSGLETMARATEDVNNPADVRAYQPGDAMKKIHWKLSLRKGELMVRRFEEPVQPDALVLMDCSAPPSAGDAEIEADMRDAMLETAASVMSETLRRDHAARLPLHGAHPAELEKSMGLPMILENLARVDFSETDRFERVLLLETRRMRRVGATVIIAARLNSHMVDMMIRMRRMGPWVRFYLVTFTPEDPKLLALISKLQQGLVEVCYVTPASA